MDKKLREDILAEVRTAMREIAETYDEKYVTGKELCQHYSECNKCNSMLACSIWNKKVT